MPPNDPWPRVVFVFAVLVQTGVLIWGLRLLADVLRQGIGADGTRASLLMLAEKPADTPGAPPTPSFSRVAGGIGAIVLASLFVGLSYWALYALFWEKDTAGLEGIGTILMAGSALFLPYGFNQLRRVFSA